MSEDIIERLNREIKEIRAAWAFETTALRAENEKLREALEGMIDLAEAANVMDDPAYDTARKTLESE